MVDIVDENDANYLVKYDDGSVDMISKSPMNRLIMERNLWGVLRSGSEIYEVKPKVRLIPGENARTFTLELGEFEPLHLEAHQKAELVDALMKGHENDDIQQALTELYDRLRNSDVRERLFSRLIEFPPFDGHAERQDGGWFINDHLLLTWDGEFYHPNTESKTRSGNIIGDGQSVMAYHVNLSTWQSQQDAKRHFELDGVEYRLSDTEMDFIARAMWAITAAPNQ
ncbi:hypothetical protein [Halomonas sp.]|uniref:hypothetical protein n=1 Tax=Halomonas sp. TaxID=1486246 RepID=UPI00356B5F2F